MFNFYRQNKLNVVKCYLSDDKEDKVEINEIPFQSKKYKWAIVKCSLVEDNSIVKWL